MYSNIDKVQNGNMSQAQAGSATGTHRNRNIFSDKLFAMAQCTILFCV